MRKVVLILALLSLVFAQQNDTVQTESGPIEGIVNATGRYFLGIPYAAPPIGLFSVLFCLPHFTFPYLLFT